jgi:hypothetical protein
LGNLNFKIQFTKNNFHLVAEKRGHGLSYASTLRRLQGCTTRTGNWFAHTVWEALSEKFGTKNFPDFGSVIPQKLITCKLNN